MERIVDYLKKHVKRKHIVLFGIGFCLILVGFLSWNLYFSKLYIFSQNEQKFTDAVKQYYYYHPEYLPKNGEVRTRTLADMYADKRLDEMKVPKSNDICDLESWVKVYNDNGEYKYHTYLKCGWIKSNVDHEGPEIVLNGDSEVILTPGQTYIEEGVKSVKDNKDGKMSVSSVTIDFSKVDVDKIGTYKVIYKAQDKLNNITTVERKVIVANILSVNAINDTIYSNFYYKGTVENNYVLFSGMLFRMLKVNDDSSITLVSAENLANLRFENTSYKGSAVEKWLNDVFLKAIDNQDYIVEKPYCVGNISDFNDIEKACSEVVTSKVGLLSIGDYIETFKNGRSFLNSDINYALANTVDGRNVVATNMTNNHLDYVKENTLPVVRAVITLKGDAKKLLIKSGNGTAANPYKLGDYSFASIGDKISTRLIGEYVNYSGMNFRIMDKYDNKVVLISADALSQKTDTVRGAFLTVLLDENSEYEYNVKNKDNPGYKINNEYIDYLNDSNILKSTYVVPFNEKGKKYDEYKTSKVEAKVALPKTYDLFSSVQQGDRGYLNLFMDKAANYKAFYLNSTDGMAYEANLNMYGAYCIRPVITVSGDMTIKKGKGVGINPYYITK